jgi:hypothetical protein
MAAILQAPFVTAFGLRLGPTKLEVRKSGSGPDITKKLLEIVLSGTVNVTGPYAISCALGVIWEVNEKQVNRD